MRNLTFLARGGLLWFACVLLGCSEAWAAESGGKLSAKAIVEASGTGRGLCVHLDFSDSSLLLEMAQAGEFVVHGLSSDRETVRKARTLIQSRRRYGEVSVEYSDLSFLPYADNLVNVLVADNVPVLLEKALPLTEILRVVRPGGIVVLGGVLSKRRESVQEKLRAGGRDFVVLKQNEDSLTIRKTWPEDLDHWTHYRYDGGQSKVSRDRRLGPPYGYRWITGPTWPVNGPKQSSSNRGMLSVNGVIYYATTNVPANAKKHPRRERNRYAAYCLLARDAFNGTLLWYRPVIEYEKNMDIVREGEDYRKAVSFAQWFGHSLATDGKYLYGSLRRAVFSVDANTGELARVFVKDLHTKGILACDSGALLARGHDSVQVFDTSTGESKWKLDKGTGRAVVGDGRVFFNVDGQMVCKDIKTGEVLWRQPSPNGHLEFYKSKIVFTHGKGNLLNAFSGDDGRRLWTYSNAKDSKESYGIGHSFFMQDLIWAYGSVRKEHVKDKRYALGGISPRTGRLEKRYLTNIYLKSGVCRHGVEIATERHIITSRPVNFLEPSADKEFELGEGRHACGLGLRVANGLLYSAPQGCRCSKTTVRGFVAIGSSKDWEKNSGHPLIKGPAYDRVQSSVFSVQGAAGGQRTGSEWPTYRHDNHRTGATKERLSSNLRLLWKTTISDQERMSELWRDEWLLKLSGEARVTGPAVADRKVFIGEPDTHQVISLDADKGKVLWRYTADGRVVVPPTVYKGLCLFGARDGWVYCLRAKDGELVWRVRAAPVESRIMAYGQLESPWPVTGGVLVEKDVAYVMVGRSHTIDGGCWLHAIDAFTGEVKSTLRHKANGTYSQLLVSDGCSVMTADGLFKFEIDKTGKPSEGILSASRNVFDRSWQRLSYTLRSSAVKGRGAWSNHKKILGVSGTLVAGDIENQNVYAYRLKGREAKTNRGAYLIGCAGGKQLWSTDIKDPVQLEAMALTPDVLFVAGPKDMFDRDGKGILRAVSPKDGSTLEEIELDALPAAEGMAVAYGRLYVATRDGKMLCFQGR